MGGGIVPRIETPPWTDTDRGPRRVGVEIEFGDIGCERAAECVRQSFGGRVVVHTRNDVSVEGTAFGDFEVKIDWRFAHYIDGETEGGIGKSGLLDKLDEGLSALVSEIGSAVMPFEIVAPPMPWSELGRFDGLLAELRAGGASDTRHWLHAFALQLNPEAHALDAASIVAMLRAYLLSSERLRAEIGVDLTRRLSSFIEPFPDRYVRKVLDPAYGPDLETLIDDYLAENPTRNRELDMLPLFTFLDEARVRACLDDDRIKARPTYHYRLPDCRLSDPGWGVGTEWNRWVSVERLAADADRLHAAAGEWLAREQPGIW